MPSDTKGMTRMVCVAHDGDCVHYATPTAMALALTAIQEGDGQIVSGTAIEAICIIDVLEGIGMDDPRRSLYRGAVDFRR